MRQLIGELPADETSVTTVVSAGSRVSCEVLRTVELHFSVRWLGCVRESERRSSLVFLHAANNDRGEESEANGDPFEV